MCRGTRDTLRARVVVGWARAALEVFARETFTVLDPLIAVLPDGLRPPEGLVAYNYGQRRPGAAERLRPPHS